MERLSKSELEQLICVMRNMERAAKDENWQELAHLDEYRRELLHYNVKQASGIDKSASLESDTPVKPGHAELVKEIKLLDEVIIKTVTNARGKLLAENRDLSAQVNAKASYALTSQFS